MNEVLRALRGARALREVRLDAAEEDLRATVAAGVAEAGADRPPRKELADRERRQADRLRDALADGRALAALVARMPQDQALQWLEPSVPLVLLPVRLETRYRRLADGAHDLWVRIYPEPLHIDAHEPGLSPAELEAARAFWTGGGADPGSAGDDAWRTLCVAVGSEDRAAWVRLAGAPGAAAQAARAPWSRPAVARALPDRFVALARNGGATVARAEGRPVVQPLPVGPDPRAAAGTGPAGLDAESAWLMDLGAAEAAGMALRLHFPAGTSPEVERLLVMGVAASLTPPGAAAELESLLGAHRFATGLDTVPAGTPTNVPREGLPPARVGRLQRERTAGPDPGTAPPEREPGSDADRLAAALGVTGAHLASTSGAHVWSEADARAMLTALWPGTLGAHLRELMARSIHPHEADLVRAHALDHVRARGPLATLRVGRQPYGVLPVTSLTRYAPAAGAPPETARLVALLRGLAATWRRSLAAVPRMGGGRPAEDALAEILALSPIAVGHDIRRLHHVGTLRHLARLAGMRPDEADGMLTIHQHLVGTGGRGLGRLRAGDGLLAIIAADVHHAAETPRIQADPLSHTDPLEEDYLTFLRTAPSAEVLKAERRFGAPLLYLLARIGVLEHLAQAVEPSRPPPETLQEWLDRHIVLDDLRDLPGPTTREDLLDLVRTPGEPGLPLVDLLLDEVRTVVRDRPGLMLREDFRPSLTPGTGPRAGGRPGVAGEGLDPRFPRIGGAPLRASAGGPAAAVRGPVRTGTLRSRDVRAGEPGVRSGARTAIATRSLGAGVPAHAVDTLAETLAALEHLAGVPTAQLDRLLCETLDLAGHRLDAWVTSLATERLRAMRATGSPGLHLGAYGWLEGLAPGPAAVPVPAGQHRDIARPLQRRPGSGGFVHAPSLHHAATAGVLRSAHLGHGGGPEFAIDLSSARVDTALWLLEGMRTGQPLGALLGYRLERTLHDAGLDHLIAGLRDTAPLTRTRLAAADEPAEAVAANEVVDGLLLLERLDAGALDVAALAPAADQAALAAALAALDDEADAVADLLTAEAVHQVVGGNSARAGAATAALAGGPPPAELDVARTPRGGTGVVHRVLLLAEGAPAHGWPGAGTSPRAVADPALEALAAHWLGSPGRVVAGVRWRDGDGAVLGPDPARPAALVRVPVADLGVAALDVVLAAAPLQPDARGDLERRIVARALRSAADGGLRPAGVPADARVEVVADTGSAKDVDLASLLEVAGALRTLLGRSRALAPADLVGAGVDGSGADLADLDGRAAAVLAAARTAAQRLAGLSTDGAEPDAAALQEALMDAAGFAVPGAWPLEPGGADHAAALAQQARSVGAELAARIAAAAAALAALT
ncbi:MAG: hypothetical protein RID94_00450, partial [Miltoncostaeaceae bacterium]